MKLHNNNFPAPHWYLLCLLLYLGCVPIVVANCHSGENNADKPNDGQFTNSINLFCQSSQLRGSWYGVAGALIPPEKIEQLPRKYSVLVKKYNVPGYWSADDLQTSASKPSFYITLWKEINLNSTLLEAKNLALWPGRFQWAYRVYIEDGRGNITKAYDNIADAIPESEDIVTTLPSKTVVGRLNSGAYRQVPQLYPGAKLIIQLYNDDYRTGGASQPPLLGDADEIYSEMLLRRSWHFLFLGACFLVAIYSLSQAIFENAQRPVYVFSVIMSLGVGLRLLVTGNLLAYFIPSLTVLTQYYLSWFSFLGLLAVFIYCQPALIPDTFERYPYLKKLARVLSLAPLIILTAFAFVGLHDFLLLGHGLRLLYIGIASIYVVFLAYQLILFPFKNGLTFLGLLLILVGGISDALQYRIMVDPYIELFSVAVFFFIATHVMDAGWRNYRLLEREKRLSLDLKRLNNNLEDQVRERTQDLVLANEQLSLAATTDSLTELPNRRAFDQQFEKEILRAKREGSDFCMAIVDADLFKSINDRYGHDFGDKVLQSISACLLERLRRTDFVARIGGEEFSLILPTTKLGEAELLMNELCQRIKTISFEDHPDVTVSVSIGISQWNGLEEFAGLYRRADQALYDAKSSGRACVRSM